MLCTLHKLQLTLTSLMYYISDIYLDILEDREFILIYVFNGYSAYYQNKLL